LGLLLMLLVGSEAANRNIFRFKAELETQTHLGKGIIYLPGAFRPPHRGHFLQIKNALARHKGEKVIVPVYSGDRHGVAQETTVGIWKIYLTALKCEFAVVALQNDDPHEWCWVNAEDRRCNAKTEVGCWVLAGDDRSYYKDKLETYIAEKKPNLLLSYEVPDVGRYEGLSATKFCKAIETFRKAQLTVDTLSGPQLGTLTAFLPEELSAQQAKDVLTLVWPGAIEADQPPPPPPLDPEYNYCCCTLGGATVFTANTMRDFIALQCKENYKLVPFATKCPAACATFPAIANKRCCCKPNKAGAIGKAFYTEEEYDLYCPREFEGVPTVKLVLAKTSSCSVQCKV